MLSLLLLLLLLENIIQISKPFIEGGQLSWISPWSGFDKILMLEQYTDVKSSEQGTYAQKFNAKCVEVKL